jgi:AraC-like DNA-binding protein
VASSYSPEPAHRAAQVRTLTTALLLLVLAMPAGTDRSRPPTHEAFVWFRDEIEASFRSCHKVTEYAARLGYSTRTLNRLARDNTGLSAKELIDERVVLEARRQLAHAQETVARIAEELGFDDPSNFSAYFHQRTGLTPGEFRARTGAAAR